MTDLVDPSIAALRIERVAFARVVPVAQVNGAVGAELWVKPAEEGVGGGHEVWAVRGGVARALSLRQIAVDARAVDVDHENGVAIGVGELITLVNQQAAVSMSAADGSLLRRIAAGLVPRFAHPVQMIGRGRKHPIRMHAPGALRSPLDMPSMDHVLKMRRHRIADEDLSELVIVHAPGIGRSL